MSGTQNASYKSCASALLYFYVMCKLGKGHLNYLTNPSLFVWPKTELVFTQSLHEEDTVVPSKIKIVFMYLSVCKREVNGNITGDFCSKRAKYTVTVTEKNNMTVHRNWTLIIVLQNINFQQMFYRQGGQHLLLSSPLSGNIKFGKSKHHKLANYRETVKKTKKITSGYLGA